MTSTSMELLLLLSLCLLAWSGSTSADGDGTTPKIEVQILDRTEDRLLLQCDVRGSPPKPKVQWLDLDKNILPAEEVQTTDSEGNYHITLQTTVTKIRYYMCIAIQEETRKLTHAALLGHWGGYHLDKFAAQQNHTFKILKIFWIVLGVVCVVLLAFLVYWYYIKKRNAGSAAETTAALQMTRGGVCSHDAAAHTETFPKL